VNAFIQLRVSFATPGEEFFAIVRPQLEKRSGGSMQSIKAARALLCVAALFGLQLVTIDEGALAQSSAKDHWVGTWATAVVSRPQGQPPAPPPQPPGAPAGPPPRAFGGPPVSVDNQTLRQIVHTSLGGERVRVVLSNAFGTAPLQIGAAHIAVRAQEASIDAKTAKALTFGGRSAATILPGAVLVSDPANLRVPATSDLVIDIYLPGKTADTDSPLTSHLGASQTNYISSTGNHSGAATFPVMDKLASWYFLARVEVAAAQGAGAVVAFGDSITDGTRSTTDTNNRWPDTLARRLAAAKMPMGVLNLGIAGNRVLGDGAGVSALARFDRDVLVQTGVTHVVILESINDIGIGRNNPTPSAEDLIAGHRQLIERAHARGLKIYGATLTPFDGAAYFTPEGEAKRQAVNEWIRNGKGYDGVIDFDKAVRDPQSPSKLLPKYNPGDNLHMNDAGYRAMGEAVDLKLFK
jgi:lysophospholipase L1-like esterase